MHTTPNAIIQMGAHAKGMWMHRQTVPQVLTEQT